MAWIKNVSVKYKIWFSFILVLLGLVWQGVNSVNSLSTVQSSINVVVEELQPTMVLSMRLEYQLQAAVSSLALYLLSKEEIHKTEYQNRLHELDMTLNTINSLAIESGNLQEQRFLEELGESLKTFKSYKEGMLALAEDEASNISAMVYASEHINSRVKEISNILNQMVRSEDEEEASEERKQLLLDVSELRYAWSNVVNEIRLFLAFRTQIALDNLTLYSQQVENMLSKVAQYGDALTFDQVDGLTELQPILHDFAQHWAILTEIHGSDRWRRDAYLIKTEITPLITKIKRNLNRHLGKQRHAMRLANRGVNTLYRSERQHYIFITFIALFLVALLAWWLSRNITKPLAEAVIFTQKIAAGKLDNKTKYRSKDEMGQLLSALAQMQRQLSERIQSEAKISAINARVKTALDSVSANVMMADGKNNIIYINDSARRMFQQAAEEIRQHLPEFDIESALSLNLVELFPDSNDLHSTLNDLKQQKKYELLLGQCTLNFIANPVFDEHGKRVGTVLEWQNRTLEISIEKEIEQIICAARQGDLSQRISMQGKEGFFNVLGGGINQLSEVIHGVFSNINDVMAKMAQGQLNNRMEGEYQGLFAEVKENVNQTFCRLEEMLLQIQQAADEINHSSKQIAEGNEALFSRSEEQASSLEETASSVEQLTSTVRQNADNAQQANGLAIEASKTAVQGQQVMLDAVKAMQMIGQSSKKIAEIIGVIDEISFQTQLLALNASVEAARAGEQGRGFAVVATEVRSLAERSTTAAKEIKTLIQESVRKIEVGTRLVNDSGDSLDEIVIRVKTVSGIIGEIAAASEEQSQGIKQVNQAVMTMDDLTQKNAALAENTSQTSGSMNQQVNQMMVQLTFFDFSAEKDKRKVSS
ncbi:MAG: methyl-accepting chemotaxis protein [Gammaproteobacteria bacterium]|nr:methyl-accepting chemotaxis protein [Gammaproteobacteria bacterium]